MKYFITPSEFFSGEENGDGDPADTTTGAAIGVLDRRGELKTTRDSGHWIFFPDIPEVGVLRQRYPILPIHGEGSSVWTELEALKDIVLEPVRYQNMYRQQTGGPAAGAGGGEEVLFDFVFRSGNADHAHMVHLLPSQFNRLLNGDTVWVNTEETQEHRHQLELRAANNQWQQVKIDVVSYEPWHSHSTVLGYAYFCSDEVELTMPYPSS